MTNSLTTLALFDPARWNLRAEDTTATSTRRRVIIVIRIEDLKNKNKVCAVGTTVMRGLETSVSSMGTLNQYRGWTHKFIFPPYKFSIADSLITNFHMPKSTLLMMVSAFCGHDFMMEAYEVAVKEKYRFYSYGDAMLIL